MEFKAMIWLMYLKIFRIFLLKEVEQVHFHLTQLPILPNEVLLAYLDLWKITLSIKCTNKTLRTVLKIPAVMMKIAAASTRKNPWSHQCQDLLRAGWIRAL
jgi:hypothetical protein